jgi:MoaA/NifB/PqqE/SkfB family radical SAM enzyme
MLQEAANEGVFIASRELTIENTTYCGAKCIMCPRDEYDMHWQHMPFELFRSAVDQAVKLGVTSLDLCGFGDPLMDPDFEEKLAYAKTNHPFLKIYISTTAHLLNKRSLPWVAKYIDTMKISNYGFSKKSYEAVHAGVVKYEKVWENVHELFKLPRGKRPYTMLSFLLFPENEHEVEDWKAYWTPIADEVMVWQPHNYGGSQSIESLAYVTQQRKAGDGVRSCGRPFKGNPFLRANGDISVCCFDFNNKLTVGNLNKTSLHDVLAGQALANVKDVHNKLAFKGCGLRCDGCDQIYDRSDALVYSNANRRTDQPTTHPEHVVRLVTTA